MLIQQAPQLETEHLILKQYTLEDFPALKECWATPEMVKINGGEKPTAETVWAVCYAISGTGRCWVMVTGLSLKNQPTVMRVRLAL
jgi:RimJ/RimL family protein N-acetyltransferase